MFTPQEIIAEAWTLTKKKKAVWRWGFASAILETLFDVKLLTYQSWFLFSYLRGDPIGFFEVEEKILQNLPLWFFVTFMITLTILFIIEIFLPKMCLGAVIGLAAKAHNKEEIKGGLVLALYNFFPIFAIHELFVLAKLTTVITICSLVLRYVQGDVKYFIIAIAFFFWFISIIFRFFANFAEEEVVIRKTNFFSAIGKSFKLIISHLSHIFFIFILLIIISVRLLLSLLVLLVIPGIILAVSVILANFFSLMLSVTIGGILGFALVIFASYYLAYLHVFQQTVWTITYIELSKMKDVDIIELKDEEQESEPPAKSDPVLQPPAPSRAA